MTVPLLLALFVAVLFYIRPSRYMAFLLGGQVALAIAAVLKSTA